jgi:GNAT superfamily N-acetyltransferase
VESARAAARDDLATLLVLAGEFVAELRADRGGATWAAREAPPPPDLAAIERAGRDEDALLLTGCIDDVVVGYAAADVERLHDGTRLAVLRALYVEPAARGVGVGHALLDAVLGWARTRGTAGLDSLALPGSRDAKNFFEAHGLVARAIVVHRRFPDGTVG